MIEFEKPHLEVTINVPIKTTQPLVSVIIPTYNYGALIGETLKSLQRQTLTEWECIIVDDGSTDNTAEVVSRFAQCDPRVRYLRQENKRQAAAKNTGLACARGRYVQFLDADDLLEPRKFELQVEFLESNPEADIIYGGVRYFTTERPDKLLTTMFGDAKPWMPGASGKGREILSPLMVDNIMVINAPLVRRAVVDDVGTFDPDLPPVEDWDYWIRCALLGKRFEYRDLEGTLALVRSHPDSSSRQTVAMLNAWRRLRRKISTLIDDPGLLRLNHEFWSQFEAGVGVQSIAQGRRLEAARRFLSAGVICPRIKGRARLLLCAMASAFVSERQMRGLMQFSPMRLPKQ